MSNFPVVSYSMKRAPCSSSLRGRGVEKFGKRRCSALPGPDLTLDLQPRRVSYRKLHECAAISVSRLLLCREHHRQLSGVTLIAFNCSATLYHDTSHKYQSNCKLIGRALLSLLFPSLCPFYEKIEQRKKKWTARSVKQMRRVSNSAAEEPPQHGLTFKLAYFFLFHPFPMPHPRSPQIPANIQYRVYPL